MKDRLIDVFLFDNNNDNNVVIVVFFDVDVVFAILSDEYVQEAFMGG